jgi:hypothetical protein
VSVRVKRDGGKGLSSKSRCIACDRMNSALNFKTTCKHCHIGGFWESAGGLGVGGGAREGRGGGLFTWKHSCI